MSMESVRLILSDEWVSDISSRILFGLSRIFFFVLNFVFECFYFFQQKEVIHGSETEILQWSATETAKNIREGKVAVVSVVIAYINRIEEVNPLLNALVVENLESARGTARAYDEYLQEIRGDEEQLAKLATEKPLFGVPFTGKDCFPVRGLTCSAGLVWRRNIVSQKTAKQMQRMLDSGAILLGLSNVPETTMSCDTYNNVYGTTRNPFDSRRSVAGSSGGEAALVAAQATSVSIGGDGGGSIRMPAAHTGVFGLKTTAGLVDCTGSLPGFEGGLRSRLHCVGPLTRHAEDLSLVLKVLAGNDQEKLNLDEPVDIESLRVYYMDGIHNLNCDSVSRQQSDALWKGLTYLEDAHSLAPRLLDLPLIHDSFAYFLATFDLGNPKAESIADWMSRKGDLNVPLECVKFLFGQSKHTLAPLYMAVMEKYAPYSEECHQQLRDASDALAKQLQNILGEDGLLFMPTLPTQAGYHRQFLFKAANSGFTSFANVIGFPAITIPMGIDGGLPTSMQVIATPHNERLLIAIAKEMEKAFGGWNPPTIQTL